ncbi:MAG: EAL domain-containing protein, partial [Acholeplasmataceae bacterium]|nr:EAL domain-containing protein [Acholeplasmataceae bacterium]
DKDLIFDDLTFKLLANFISYELKNYQQLSQMKEHYKRDIDLFNSNVLALSYGINPIRGNNAFRKLFKANRLTFSELLLKINPKERIKYNELMDLLLRKEIKELSIKVTLDEKTLYINHVLNEEVYGFYIDITKFQNKHDALMEKALKTPINTYTLFAFEEKFNTYIKNKTTFLLVELDNIDNIITLYGKDEGKEYFHKFASYLTNYGNVYLFDGNSVILTFDFNDVRSVIKRVNSIFIDHHKLGEIKPFSFKIGIIRYPVNTKEKNINKIYEYLNVSLDKARLSHNNYAFFNYEDYEQTVFEVEIIRQIERLINLNQLEVTFTQIVNQKTNTVYAYDIGLYSESLKINPNYYYLVAKKKDSLKALERYMLKETFKALEYIYKETNRYIKLSINVSAETIRDADFNAYLIGLYKTYDIPYNAIDIIILMKHGMISDYETTKELNDLGILIGTDNLSFLKEPQTKIFHYKELPDYLDEKALSFIDYLNKFSLLEGIDLIIYNVNNAKDKLLLKTKGCAFIRGDSVDKKFTLSEIVNLIKGVI